MNENNWRSDPTLSGISAKKLDYLEKIVIDMNKLSQKERMPFLLAVAAKMRADGIALSKEEVIKIISVIKKNSSPEDAMRMEQLSKLFS